MKAPLTLDQHNILDYVHGGTVAACPFIFRFTDNKRAAAAFLGLGLGTISYSLMTRYRYSIAKIIPLGIHMSLDVGSGVMLSAAPWVLGYKHRLNPWQLALHFVLGAGAIGVVAMTQTRTERGRIEGYTEQLTQNEERVAA